MPGFSGAHDFDLNNGNFHEVHGNYIVCNISIALANGPLDPALVIELIDHIHQLQRDRSRRNTDAHEHVERATGRPETPDRAQPQSQVHIGSARNRSSTPSSSNTRDNVKDHAADTQRNQSSSQGSNSCVPEAIPGPIRRGGVINQIDTSDNPSRDTLVRQFSDDLGTLKSPIPLHEAPSDWLDANMNQIWNAIDNLPSVERSDFVDLDNSVYPRFMAYTLVCLKFYNGNHDPRLLISLKQKQSEWIASDIVLQMASHQSIQCTLWDFLSKCDGYSLIFRKYAEKILRLDIFCIAARILSIQLTNDQRMEELADQKRPMAQAILDLLQALLDFPHLGPARPSILRVTCTLSKKFCLYPTSLELPGVSKFEAVSGGSFGDIWKGNVGRDVVAIKVICDRNADPIVLDIKKFINEAILWRQFHHPNILPLYGISLSPQDPHTLRLISPWMKNGNIVEYLRKAPHANCPRLVLDIALGLEYLHTFDPPVIHGDLKGTNILLAPCLRACVADFGLCNFLPDQDFSCTPTSATTTDALIYRAPELLGHGGTKQRNPTRKSRASDIYSFGCVCYEVFTGNLRFSNLPIPDAINASMQNFRSIQPTSVDNTLWTLVENCWQVEPKLRPTIGEIVQSLKLRLDTNRHSDPHPCDWVHWDQGIMSHLRSPILISPVFEVLTRLPDDQTLAITDKDTIIALMGPTGTGKSTFVNTAMRYAVAVVGNDLNSCTQDVRAFSCLHPDGSGRKVVIVDTPGFSDTQRSDYNILKVIAQWLEQTYRRKITLTGILQFHNIADRRVRGADLRNLGMFQRLCGDDALRRVILTTTCWDEVSEEVGSEREHQLKSKIWKPMVERGSEVARFHPATYESAWDLIDRFNTSTSTPLKIQEELVDGGMKLDKTSAFQFLSRWWDRFLKKLKGLGKR